MSVGYEGKDSDLVKVSSGKPVEFIIGDWGVNVSDISVYVNDEIVSYVTVKDNRFTLPTEIVNNDFKVMVKAESEGTEIESEEVYIISE